MNKLNQLFCFSIVSGLLSCGDVNVNIGNGAPAAEEAPKTESPAAAQQAPVKPAETLPVVKASAGNQRIMDWGKKPEEALEGPTENWVRTHMMCDGVYGDQLRVSSTLAPQGKNNYKASNLGDDDPTTAWVEGHTDYGVGEYIELNNWSPMGDGTISILNGYQASESSWENNSRVKQLKVSLNNKDYCIIELSDVMGIQQFKFPKDLQSVISKSEGKSVKLRFTITDVYPGIKWKDTAISEIFSCGG